jgi:hypothetical protein
MPRAKTVVTSVVAAGAIAVSAVLVVSYTGPRDVANAEGLTLTRTSSGLALDEPFDTAVPARDIEDGYEFNGSAAPGIGYIRVESSGLKVGVHDHRDGFKGWFAVTRKAFPQSGVYHVEMSKPPGNVAGTTDQGEAVFAVQTGTTKQNGLINYVVVASNSTRGSTSWLIGYAHGHVANAQLETLMSTKPSSSAASKLDITLRTDGRRSLQVWVGAVLAFDSRTLHLDIAPPYQPYLEVQSRRIPYESSFQNFWVTSSDSIAVGGLVAGEGVDLVTPSGSTIASAPARGSTAKLTLPPPQCRGTASLVVHRPGGAVRLGPFRYAGGDTYELK